MDAPAPAPASAPASAPAPYRCGLLNVGNTCSVNALTQCITHCPALVAALAASGHPRIRKNRSHVFSAALRNLIRDMAATASAHLAPEAPSPCPSPPLPGAEEASAAPPAATPAAVDRTVAVNPQGYLRALYDSVGDAFTPGEQQDLTELWLYLSDALMEEHGQTDPEALAAHYRVCPETLRALNAKSPAYARTVLESAAAWARFQKLTGISPFQQAVQGLLISQVRCSAPGCGHTCHNHEPFTVLSLEIPEPPAPADAADGAPSAAPPPPVSLHDCLNEFYRSEPLEHWTCDRCKETQRAEKVMRVWKPPAVLAISLKRFKYTTRMSKVRTRVSIPGGITFFAGSVLGPADRDTETTYALRGFAMHHGGVHGGHYTAVGAVPRPPPANGPAWYYYDDTQVAKIRKKEQDAVFQANPDVYLVFYERVAAA